MTIHGIDEDVDFVTWGWIQKFTTWRGKRRLSMRLYLVQHGEALSKDVDPDGH